MEVGKTYKYKDGRMVKVIQIDLGIALMVNCQYMTENKSFGSGINANGLQ